jgi:hypothetical protein
MFWQHTLASATDLDPWSSWFIFGHDMWWDLGIVVALALAFIPRIGLGLLAGAIMVFIFVPTVAVLVIFGVYLAFEWIARGLLLFYNWLLVDRLGAKPVENIPAVMTLSKTPVAPGMRRGCPELAIDAAPPATTDPSS